MDNKHLKQFSVLYEDNHLLIVSKSAGVLSQKDHTGDNSIIEYAKLYVKDKYAKPGNVFLGLPHRLDRPVSGVIVLCKTSKSLSRMTQMIKDRKVTKIYHAIVSGRPREEKERVISYIKKDQNKNKVTIKDFQFSDAKKGILSYNILQAKNGKTLLEVNLETGRPHQIRAQLSHIGTPIIGDLKYGAKKPLSDKSIGLHARQIEFMHPVSQVAIRVTAEWPNKAWWSPFQ